MPERKLTRYLKHTHTRHLTSVFCLFSGTFISMWFLATMKILEENDQRRRGVE